MKSIIASVLCFLFMVCFSISHAVTFTSQYNGDGTFDILYEGLLPTGLAFDITLPDGLTTDYTLCNVNPYYNFFPDWVYVNVPAPEDISDILGVGHPLTEISWPYNIDGPTSEFCVSMAAFMPYWAYETSYDEDTGELILGNPIGDLPTYDLDMDGHVGFLELIYVSVDWLYLTGPGEPLSLADFNGDGAVNMLDLGSLNGLQYINTSSSGVLMTIEVSDYDPMVDYGEIAIELDALRGGICEVPEPATLFILGFGSLAFIRKRK